MCAAISPNLRLTIQDEKSTFKCTVRARYSNVVSNNSLWLVAAVLVWVLLMLRNMV